MSGSVLNYLKIYMYLKSTDVQKGNFLNELQFERQLKWGRPLIML